MKFTQADINNLLKILGQGRQQAQTAATIETILNRRHGFQITGNQVKARSLITFSIQHGHLIKSSTANPAGYWLENDPVEIRRYLTSLRRRAERIIQRANNLEANLTNG
jgi:hypothetical protein